MSLLDLVSGGAGCGASNPLQSIAKRLGQDRGVQHDTYSQPLDTPLSQQQASFRSNQAGSSHHPSFFSGQPHQSALTSSPNVHDAFDVSQLRANLPTGSRMPIPPPTMSDFEIESSFRPSFSKQDPIAAASRAPSSTWATHFLQLDSLNRSPQLQQRGRTKPPQIHSELQSPHLNPDIGMGMGTGMGMGMGMDMGRGMSMDMTMRMGIIPASGGMQVSHAPCQRSGPSVAQSLQRNASATAVAQTDQARWAEAFTAFDASSANKSQSPLSSTVLVDNPTPASEAADYNDPRERDELACAAGKLISFVEHDQSTKFKQSNFLDLMRKIRDRQAGIQGTDIVENVAEQHPSSETVKGKARDTSGDNSVSQPLSQQEAYLRANQLASADQTHNFPPSFQKSLGSHRLGQPMIPPLMDAHQEIANRQAINDLWAEEDARSEAIERQAIQEVQKTFVGDGGDVATRMQEDDAEAQEFSRYQRLGANVPHASTSNSRWEEDMNPAPEQEDDELDFVGRRWEGTKGRGYPGAQAAEWDKLQSDWDNFEVTSAGIRPVQQSDAVAYASTTPASASTQQAPAYRFLSDNPYIASTRQHATHGGGMPAGLESVLEKEAEVQQNPQNASAWYNLGVKQQENEREVQAIAALHKAVQLDPQLRDAWLALAVSYTNENDRGAAYAAVEKWIEMNDKYKDATSKVNAELSDQEAHRVRSDSIFSQSTPASIMDKHSRLTNLLIAMARYGDERGEVDADVQVALGVLFNSSEDYDKAVDCFSTALSVRPSDWLLYNRLGATLSNSGRSAEAIQYYHHALNLQPEFVRCHFNLSISCLNLKMYQDAAEHIYTALTLQQAEAETLQMVSARDNPNQPWSATSGSLWETFRVALELLNRPDLAAKCAMRDVHAFDLSDLVAPVAGIADGRADHNTSDY